MSCRPEFWDTMKILVERDFKRNISDDVTEWLDNVVKRWVSKNEDEEIENSDAVRKRLLSGCSDLDIQLEENIQKFLKALDTKFKKVDYRYEQCAFIIYFLTKKFYNDIFSVSILLTNTQ